MEILLAFLPYLIVLFGGLLAYFGIKHKGVIQEREKQQAEKVKEVAIVQAKVQTAINKDIAINTKVENEVKKIEQKAAVEPTPSKPNKFRF